jgi:hypothetical protein
MCLNVFCCRSRDEWPFQSRLADMFGAQDVSVRAIVRPYATQGITHAHGPAAQKAAATGGQA